MTRFRKAAYPQRAAPDGACLPVFAMAYAPMAQLTGYYPAMHRHRRVTLPPRSPPPRRGDPAAVTARRGDPAPGFRSGALDHAQAEHLAARFQTTDPYLDYGRFLTPEGGVLLIYKDLDLRWRHTFWRLLAWSVTTGHASWVLRYDTPVHAAWINVLCFVAVAFLNWLIVARPVEVYRRLEVRPDCLILEDTEVFWRERMDGGLPRLEPDEDGNQVLCNVYGTRFVEYGTLRRFDEFDRMPEVFAAHLAAAIEQLWD